MRLASLLLLAHFPALPQNAVTIHVDGNAKIGPFKPITSYFGYDEPNYTYADNGRKLISPEQYAHLEQAGQLELLESPKWLSNNAGKVDLEFQLPRQAVSLVQLSW
jgi:hypothetical protein